MKKPLLILLISFFIHSSLFINNCYAQWYRQSVPVTNSITGIKFIDSLKGWACTNWNPGGNSYILFTSDGGVNWATQFTLVNNNATSMAIVDANTGYVTGYNLTPGDAFVFKTTNGGANWYNLNAPIGADADDIFFLNRDSGYVCGNFSINLYTTTDGGLSWQTRTNGIVSHPYRLFFINYNTGYCGADFYLYKTTNAGVNWTQISSFGEQVYSIFFLDFNSGWLGFTNSKISFTSDGGMNWHDEPNPSYGGAITDIYFTNSQIGWAGNRSIYVYRTTNGGQLWGYQRDTSGSYKISVYDNLKAWSGDGGISHTINGGGNITYVGIENTSNEIPRSFELYQNYPNPFNPVTNIRFDIKKETNVKLVVLDVLGREVAVLINQELKPGTYEFNYDAADLASGVYFYKLTADNYNSIKKMVLIK